MHAGVGAAAGTLFGLVRRPGSRSVSVLQGMAYGLGIWAAASRRRLPGLYPLPRAKGKGPGRSASMKTTARMVTDRGHVLRQAILACRKGGTVSIPGIYGGFVDKMPMGAAINKGLTFKMGQTHVHSYMRPLLGLIEAPPPTGCPAASATAASRCCSRPTAGDPGRSSAVKRNGPAVCRRGRRDRAKRSSGRMTTGRSPRD